MLKSLRNILPPSVLDLRNKLGLPSRSKVKNSRLYLKATRNLSGIEIGGPSSIFRTKIPVYKACSAMAFANYSRETVWEGKLSSTVAYYNGKTGAQYIAEATTLDIFQDNQFDFLLSSNCLEHVANPIKALKEWKRITSGKIILVVPRKDFNFDHKRQVTSFEHLMEDFNNDVDESDLTHLEEILSLHDLSLDPAAGTLEQFHQRSLDNVSNRCLHHHVFDDAVIGRVCDDLDMSVIEQSANKRNWIFLIDTKQ